MLSAEGSRSGAVWFALPICPKRWRNLQTNRCDQHGKLERVIEDRVFPSVSHTAFNSTLINGRRDCDILEEEFLNAGKMSQKFTNELITSLTAASGPLSVCGRPRSVAARCFGSGIRERPQREDCGAIVYVPAQCTLDVGRGSFVVSQWRFSICLHRDGKAHNSAQKLKKKAHKEVLTSAFR